MSKEDLNQKGRTGSHYPGERMKGASPLGTRKGVERRPEEACRTEVSGILRSEDPPEEETKEPGGRIK